MTSSTRRAPWVRSSDEAPAHPPRLVPCWYMVAPSRSLRRGEAKRFEIGEESVVVFRGRESGVIRALPTHCRHQGVDLSHGDVVGDRLRCPLHHWLYSDRCEVIPGRTDVPPDLRVPALTAVEQSGMIFVHVGAEPRFPPPAFTTVDPATLHFVSGTPAVVDCPWYVPIANAFDMSHLATVHRRRLLGVPEITRPDAMTFHVRYATAVTGRGWSDRAMRLLSGNRIEVVVSCVGGTTVVVEANVGGRRSYLMVSLRPVPRGVSLLPVVGVPRRRFGLHRVHARVAMALFLAFLRRDVRALEGIRFTPRFDDERDATLEAFYRYLCSLPEYERKEIS